MADDMVMHPKHYNQGKLEVIDAIEGLELGFHEGTILRYIVRAKFKQKEIQDLQKADWYLRRLIAIKKKEKGLSLTLDEDALFRKYTEEMRNDDHD